MRVWLDLFFQLQLIFLRKKETNKQNKTKRKPASTELLNKLQRLVLKLSLGRSHLGEGHFIIIHVTVCGYDFAFRSFWTRLTTQDSTKSSLNYAISLWILTFSCHISWSPNPQGILWIVKPISDHFSLCFVPCITRLIALLWKAQKQDGCHTTKVYGCQTHRYWGHCNTELQNTTEKHINDCFTRHDKFYFSTNLCKISVFLELSQFSTWSPEGRTNCLSIIQYILNWSYKPIKSFPASAKSTVNPRWP